VRRAVGAAKTLLWVCAALIAVLVALAWAAPGLRDEWSFLLLGGAAVVPATACSAFLFWQELRANRQELRDARRESRDVPFEEGAEWTSKVAFYFLAFFLSFSLSWYVLPALLLSFFS
jgi:type VI protein secretion system component VasK